MNLSDLPWTKVRDALQRGPVVAILPCGATEAHGPHLPLNTDVIISEGVARRAAAMLDAQHIEAVVLPSLAYSPAGYAAEFPGTITIGAAAAKAVLLDIARCLKVHRFACLAIANSHFDPVNVAMLREAAEEISLLGLPVVFPDFTRRALAQTLTQEFIDGACHAGQFETSLMLADRPDLVDNVARAELPENPASLTQAFSRGANSFAEAGGPDAYFGDPRNGAAKEGETSYQTMALAIVRSVSGALKR